MRVLRAPWSPTVTHHVSGDPTTDVYGNEVDAFTDKRLPVLAEFPGNAGEQDNPAGDVVTADRVLLVDPFVVVSTQDEFTCSDAKRYKVDSVADYRNPWTGTAITQVGLRRVS